MNWAPSEDLNVGETNSGSALMEEVKDATFTSAFHSALYALFESETFCDVTLELDTGSALRAHKVVLAAASPYFAAMFSVDMREALTSVVSLKLYDSECLRVVIRYMYTSDIQISNDNVQEIVRLSDLFQLDTLKSRCEDFMVCGAEPSNALGLVTLGSMYRLDRLKTKAASILASKFAKVIQHDAFMELGVDGVVGYIKQNWIKVRTEDIILHAALCWVRHAAGERAGHLDTLLGHVRLHYCTPAYLRSLMDEEELLAAPQHQALLARAMCQVLTGPAPGAPPPRLLYPKCTLQLAILGGTKFDGQNPHGWRLRINDPEQVEAGEPRHEWVDFTPEDTSRQENSFKYHQLRRGYRACVVENSIVITGLDHNNTSRCQVYDLVRKQSSFPPGPRNGRTAHTAIGMGDYAFVVGGVSRNNEQLNEMKSVEFMDMKTHKWASAADFQFAVRSPILCVLGMCLYVMGGHQQTVQAHIHVSKGMYMYNRITDSWYKKAVMPTGLPSGSALPYKGVIYVFGGSEQMFMAYAPPTDTWTQLTRPTFCHLGAPAVILNDKLWLLGGMRNGANGHECHKIIEQYELCAARGSGPRGGAGAAWTVPDVELPVGLTNHMALLVNARADAAAAAAAGDAASYSSSSGGSHSP